MPVHLPRIVGNHPITSPRWVDAPKTLTYGTSSFGTWGHGANAYNYLSEATSESDVIMPFTNSSTVDMERGQNEVYGSRTSQLNLGVLEQEHEHITQPLTANSNLESLLIPQNLVFSWREREADYMSKPFPYH